MVATDSPSANPGKTSAKVDSGSLPDHFAAGEHQDLFPFDGYSHCCHLMLRLQLELCSAGRGRSEYNSELETK